MGYKSALPFLVFGALKCLNILAIYPKKMNSTYKYNIKIKRNIKIFIT